MSIDNATKREWDEARKGVEWDQEKDRIRDLMKAKHSIDLELQLVYGCDKDGNRIGKYTKEISI